MHRCVSDFELTDDDETHRHPAAAHRHKNHDSFEEDLLELPWRKGPVAQPVQDWIRQKAAATEACGAGADAVISSRAELGCSGGGAAAPVELFMEEEEMMSWLRYQIGEDEGGGGGGTSGGGYFYREGINGFEAEQIASDPAAERRGNEAAGSRESMAVDSSETPGEAERPTAVDVETVACGAAGAASGERKRRTREAEDNDHRSGDAEFGYGDKRKDARRTAATRRTRAAEVHNLSERRRRDRINEKMKTLQELIPRCNKSDKASMLDEAIEYLKSLQLQIQMMSMGHMVPMMFPGVRSFYPPMGMGVGVGVGMGMGMGMGTGVPMETEMGARGLGHAFMQFAPMLSSPPFTGSQPTLVGPRPLVPTFHSPNMVVADRFRSQASSNQQTLKTVSMQGSHNVQDPNAVDSYHQYDGPQQLQASSQIRLTAEPGIDKSTWMATQAATVAY